MALITLKDIKPTKKDVGKIVFDANGDPVKIVECDNTSAGIAIECNGIQDIDIDSYDLYWEKPKLISEGDYKFMKFAIQESINVVFLLRQYIGCDPHFGVCRVDDCIDPQREHIRLCCDCEHFLNIGDWLDDAKTWLED